ncbi:MAG: Gfo/Idh/MocA family oxidoreductase, partial [Verrucomicrobia bacterium]|nr:Gfo/Idh/MocA family oxidoreductase [Verrucomicrobiota bacterium]
KTVRTMKTPVNSAKTLETSRRQFLKTSATVVSAAALGGLDLARSAYAAGSDILRVGMIGCGGRCAGAAAQALTADPGARLVAMCDLFLERVQGKRQLLKEQKPQQVQVDDDHCFTGFEGYKHVIEACDVVLIANAAKFHPFHTQAAIAAGRHVFVEKPHGIDPAGIKTMQAACDLARQKKLCVASGLHSRHHPGYIETIQRIHDGAIGQIVAIEENFLRGPYGVIPRKEGLNELQWQCSTQYHFTWLSGDDVVQSLVHNLDRASWALGGAVPIKCHGLGGRSAMFEPIYGDVFDHHSVIYEFAGGVRLYAFCRTTMGCYDESSSIILGSQGRASILNCRIQGQTNWQWRGEADPYQIEHDKLFAAIRSGNPVNNGDYMTRSTLIAVMGQLSCYTGKEISWDQIQASDFSYAPKPADCHDGMEPPVKPGANGSYPVPLPGQTRLTLA